MYAEAIVATSGYNTVIEILSMRKRALVAPRCTQRTEQLIRAERLKAMEHVDHIRAEAVTDAGILDWISTPAPDAANRTAIDFRGLDRITHFPAELTGSAIAAAPADRSQIKLREGVSLAAE